MAEKKEIVVKCRGAESVSYEKLAPLQGPLKELSSENYVKLRKEILELGFSEPFSVWKNEKKIIPSKWSPAPSRDQENGRRGGI